MDIRNGKIDGINVTVPFKKSVIPFLDKLEIPERIQSVNTIYKEKTIKGSNQIVGRNNKQVYAFGDKVTVKVLRTDLRSRTIDLDLFDKL